MGDLSLIILAAGQGKRMKSEDSKVIHRVCGKEMINHVLDAAVKAGCVNATVVVGHRREQVIRAVGEKAAIAVQEEQLGTGHAVMQAAAELERGENVLILSGDTPLITAETLQSAIVKHIEGNYGATVITARVPDPTGYGRIVRSGGEVEKIVEQKDATDEEKLIDEVNSGMYCFNSALLKNALSKITADNAQGEYYLTDVFEILKNEGVRIGAFEAKNYHEILGVNDRVQLSEAEKLMRARINRGHMLGGVTLIDPDSTYIGPDVEIGMDTVIYPGTILEGRTTVADNVIIGQNCRLVNASIARGVDIWTSTIIDSSVDEGAHVGPYAYIRPGSAVGKDCKVGDFVELKKATIGDGTKISHLTYIGDADVGAGCNFGCGTVVVNYDGKNKYRTVIGDHAFIGCNSNLVSPVTINDGAYVAAGSTITDDVPSDTLAIARARQVIKENWKDRRDDG